MTGPPPNSTSPTSRPPTGDHQRRATNAKITTAAYLTASSRVRCTGTVEQVAQRAEVRLAGDRVAGDRRDRERQEQRQLDALSAASATKMPLLVIGGEEVRPARRRPRGPATAIFTATAMMIGTAASTARPAWLRRRPKISRSSERRNRVESRRGHRHRRVTLNR